ncbi:STAS domain-containing protein [Cyclobacterium marinum]|uniref:Anti-sigma factor antagonist n=1 Tax=Cyclobacterium marinum (strain ATCC 25205 / DSM 745 / LMG 13164 / NCIMB 1802) TaxID=880070 RepID=G0J1F1_CYCMS|nr:STAS domain-containing protein [Cyclobacterium marinum]AEL26590.1 anti-anti-sigma factor [Cyclobacterium marinum DSM 745]MBI0399919.1 STAS domain-containing protein [Cyclobacterium marinum]MBR9776387.1 STAS domain-containing protein [Cytophagales bacterium]|tara:strand:- start:5355 stop:5699 length:345 start_codon:yes stop_codon:yes gene_type:complete
MKAEFQSQIENNSLVLKIKGDLIGDDSGPRMVGLVSDGLQDGVKNCIIDLSEVRYISSSGIGVLITVLTKMRNADGEVFLASPSEHVKKLLIITKLNNIFNVSDTLEEALAQVK